MPADPTHILLTIVIKDPRPSAPSELAMGFAYAKEDRSNRAVIIFQNIQAFAARNASAGELYLLTGAAIAHELGHLVFHTTHHSEGLMRAKWTTAELQRMNMRALRFSKDQSEQLQTALLARR